MGPLPSEAPLHRAVDRHDVVRELRRFLEGVVRTFDKQRAEVLGVLPPAVRCLPSARGAATAQMRSSRRSGGRLAAVLAGLPVERLDGLAVLPVKARAGLHAEAPLPTRSCTHSGSSKSSPVAALARRRRARRRRDRRCQRFGRSRDFGPPIERTGERIDFIDGEVELLHQPHVRIHAVDARVGWQ